MGGFLAALKAIGEFVGLVKPHFDKKEKAKQATGEAMKVSGSSPSPSIQIQDEIDQLKIEMQADFDKLKGKKSDETD